MVRSLCSNGGACFDGVIDEVRIWTTARSEQQIREHMNQLVDPDEPGLAAYWRFDEGTGDTVYDLTGNGYQGQLGSFPGRDPADPLWVPSDVPTAVGDEAGEVMVPDDAGGSVELVIYSLQGRLVRTLTRGRSAGNTRVVPWDGRDERGIPVPSGIYLCRLTSGRETMNLKMIMQR